MQVRYLDLFNGKIARLQPVRAASKTAPVWCSSWVEFTALPRGEKRSWAACEHATGSAIRRADAFVVIEASPWAAKMSVRRRNHAASRRAFDKVESTATLTARLIASNIVERAAAAARMALRRQSRRAAASR